MLNRISLRARLTIITGLIIIFIAICLTISSIYNADTNLKDLVYAAKTTTTTATATYTTIDSSASTEANAQVVITPDISTASIDGTAAKSSENSIKYDRIPASNISSSVSNAGNYQGTKNDIFKIGIDDNNPKTIITIAADAKKQFTYSSIIFMILIIFIGMTITYIVLGRALKPVKDLSKIIKNINENNLEQHIENFTTKDEIGSLAASFNLMMDRLSKSFAIQKQFASNAAHELKTPLAIIKSGIQVLKMEERPSLEDYKENVEITEQSIERLIQIVNDLLKLNTKNLEKFTDKISIQETIQNILSELKPITEKKEISIQLGECNEFMLGNAILIYRALFNLIENAVKYNKEKGSINISATLKNNSIIINISDTGMGIAAEELPNIFEPFYRVDKSRSREIGGSGLGLSIVKTIIDKHDGTITVTSIQNVGTNFQIMLPSKKHILCIND